MNRVLLVIITIITTSCFFFPFEFTALPGANTKMILAGFGLGLLLIRLSKEGKGAIRTDLFPVFAASLLVSLLGFISTVVNDTRDYTYATYFVSFAVWLSAAYVVVTLIKGVHNYISIELLVRYLAAVCVMQCCLAMIFQSSPVIDSFIQSHINNAGMKASLESLEGNRLYGIGAALDVAGTRFASVIVLISAIISINKLPTKWIIFYAVSWFVILVIGNMISRTTIIGAGIGFSFIIFNKLLFHTSKEVLKKIRKVFSGALLLAIPICIILYNTNENFYNNIRFGFEGIFSLVEEGQWNVSSNNKLKTMYVFPDNTKTWIIGDGYFEAQKNDPYYIGKNWVYFYMGTDVGYLRFIFYFGLTGLAAFMLFFVIVGKNCIERFHRYRWAFVFLVALNFIIWFKVSTDIFVVFAPFLCLSTKDEEEYEQGQEYDEENEDDTEPALTA